MAGRGTPTSTAPIVSQTVFLETKPNSVVLSTSYLSNSMLSPIWPTVVIHNSTSNSRHVIVRKNVEKTWRCVCGCILIWREQNEGQSWEGVDEQQQQRRQSKSFTQPVEWESRCAVVFHITGSGRQQQSQFEIHRKLGMDEESSKYGILWMTHTASNSFSWLIWFIPVLMNEYCVDGTNGSRYSCERQS